MKIVFSGTTLMDDANKAFGTVTLNGTNIADVRQLAQASQPAIFSRGNFTNTIQITVSVTNYTSFVNAQFAFWTLGSYLTPSGPLTVTCGDFGDTPQIASAANCVLQSVSPKLTGVSLTVTFTLVCGLILGGGPPGFVTTSPIVYIPFQQAITNGANTAVVTFSTAFGAGVIPTISGIVAKPGTTDVNLFCDLIVSSISNTGCTFKLSGPAPSTGYVLHGSAAA